MKSIAARLAVGAGLILTAFVLLTALATQKAVEKRARAAQYDKLQGLIYGLLGAADTGESGRLLVDEFALPDGRLNQPGSELVAQITRPQGSLWRSNSLYFDLPTLPQNELGQWEFSRVAIDADTAFFVMQFSVEWESDTSDSEPYTFAVAQDTGAYDRQLEKFDTQLWTVLLIAAFLLLLFLLAVLYWSLYPLKRVTSAVHEIELGHRERLDLEVPRELEALASGLNGLLQSEQTRQTRYRNALDDLAHSLKTPLSVLRNLADGASSVQDHNRALGEQVTRIDEIVAHRLHTTAVTNRSPLARQFNLHTLVQRIVSTLAKVYADKTIYFDVEIDHAMSVRLNEGDTMEMLGNLLENACKYCESQVTVRARVDAEFLEVDVIDDGAGFPEGMPDILERGTRADARHPGQGLGLAIARDLALATGGDIEIPVPQPEGALIRLKLPQ
ncbi:MAG: ATP-binding protein [Pseudomonadota bacterium]